MHIGFNELALVYVLRVNVLILVGLRLFDYDMFTLYLSWPVEIVYPWRFVAACLLQKDRKYFCRRIRSS